jgi:hypothetical protein
VRAIFSNPRCLLRLFRQAAITQLQHEEASASSTNPRRSLPATQTPQWQPLLYYLSIELSLLLCLCNCMHVHHIFAINAQPALVPTSEASREEGAAIVYKSKHPIDNHNSLDGARRMRSC